MPSLSLQSESAKSKTSEQRGATQRISELASNLETRLNGSVSRISGLNVETRFVALNARIEAGRAGGVSGRAFDVVAQAIQDISQRTAEVADNLKEEFRNLLREMREITEELAIRTRGERLSHLALTNIDLIDRNLYERSCDVRWWATDQSVVDALVEPTRERLTHATKRLGQILDSYTVYFDIIIMDLEGRVLANGRPELFHSVGSNQAPQPWFEAALKTRDGTQYVQSDVEKSSLCGGERAMIFACTVRADGQANGKPIGVLAVVFRWDALAQTVVENTPLSVEEWKRSRVCIMDASGKLLADTAQSFDSVLSLPNRGEFLKLDRGYRMVAIDEVPHCVALAHSPGYETYRTGWYSLVLQSDSDE